jgi:two-component system cell cycle sensor histidine kinase/response regulator CckA
LAWFSLYDRHMQTATRSATELECGKQRCQHLQEQLRHMQKIETLGHLSGGMAHDFANVLTVIIGSSEQLVESLPAADSRGEYARDILDAATRARSLTAQFLALSRSERPQPTVIDLNTIVRGMQNILARTIREDIALEFRLAAGIDPVRLDKVQLEQVLINLVVNARDAMPHGGKVTIETRFMTLTAAVGQRSISLAPGRYVVLSVADTGCGMSAETRRRLFEPLFTTKASGDGTGFGLFTCDTIVRESGGLIFVDSEPDAGSVFTVLLPAWAASEEKLRATPTSTGNVGGHESVLLLEDSPEVRTVVRRMLDGLGYRVFEAATAHEALAVIDLHGDAIDLVLSDVIIPEVSGMEVVRRVQARVPGIKALFMSGHSTQALLRHNRLPEGANFIQKPFGRLAFGQKLREVLDA